MKRLLALILTLAMVLAMLPAVSAKSETKTSTNTHYTYKDIVKRTYDMSYLATEPKPGEGGKEVTSTDPASIYNEATGKYENWGGNYDMTGFVRQDGNYRVLADLEGPGYINRIWIPTYWTGTMRIWIDGALTVETQMADFIYGSAFEGLGELSLRANEQESEQFAEGYLGGINLFVPITYNESCKIEVGIEQESSGFYYIVGYYDLEDGASVESFAWPMSEENRQALEEANAILADESVPAGTTCFDGEVKACETVTLFEKTSAGAISASSLKLDIPKDELDKQKALTDWTIEMYWDGSDTPAVSMPVADFFGVHYGLYDQGFDNAAYGLSDDGIMYTKWYMPFNSAKITLTNGSDTARSVKAAYRTEDLTEEQANTLTRFHANWQRCYARTDDRAPDAQMLSIEGKGRYVGTSLHIYQIVDGIWWGEGDEKFFIDGEKFPTWFGTGSEDYFCYAWCGSQLFDYPYCGQPLCNGYPSTGDKQVQGHGDKVNYRIHVLDNICFQSSLEANIEKYFDETVDRYAATTYFYLTKDTSDKHIQAEISDRIFNDDLLSGPSLFYPGSYLGARELAGNTTNRPYNQGMGFYGEGYDTKWYGGVNYCWANTSREKYVQYLLEIPEGGEYQFIASLTTAPDYGIFEFYIDDVLVGKADTYGSLDVIEKTLGTVTLTPGAHVLKILCVGKNSASAGYYMGINYLQFTPAEKTDNSFFFGGCDDLFAAIKNTDGLTSEPVVQGLDVFCNEHYTWHKNSHLVWNAGETGSVEFEIEIPAADTYQMELAYTVAYDFGKFNVSIDGTPVLKNVDGCTGGSIVTGDVAKAYNVELTAGKHIVTVTGAGKNAGSGGYLVGIDYLRFSTQKEVGAFYGGITNLLENKTSGDVATQDLGWVATYVWYRNAQLYFQGADNAAAEFMIELPADGDYSIKTDYTAAGDFGQFRLYIDGEAVGDVIDGFSTAVGMETAVAENVHLTGGAHTLKIQCVGKNDAASGYLVGISSIEFTAPYGTTVTADNSFFFGGCDDLLATIKNTDGLISEPVVQGLDVFCNEHYTWHKNSHLVWNAGEIGSVEFEIEIPAADTYMLELAHTIASDFGKFSVSIDGKTVLKNVDGYIPGTVTGVVAKAYNVELTAGKHLVTVSGAGKNASSAGYLIGIDYLRFSTQKEVGAFYGGVTNLLENKTSGDVATQDLGWVATYVWYRNAQLYFQGADNAAAEFMIELPADGDYTIKTDYTAAGDFGQFQLYIDGDPVGDVIDGFSTAVGMNTAVAENVHLTGGVHTLKIQCVGKNDSAAGYLVGISCIEFKAPYDAGSSEPVADGKLTYIQQNAVEELRQYAQNALNRCDALQTDHIRLAMAAGMMQIAAADDADVAAALAAAKAEIDKVLATTYEEELEVDLFEYDGLFFEGGEIWQWVSSYTSTNAPGGQSLGSPWSNGAHLFWIPDGAGDEVQITLDVEISGTYDCELAYTTAPDYGEYDVYLDGVKLGAIDGYGTLGVEKLSLGEVTLTKGEHILKIVVTGKNDASSNYAVGIDHLYFQGDVSLAQYQIATCKYLDGYKSSEDYSFEQWKVVQETITEQKAIINSCITVEEVIAAWKAAKTALDAIATGIFDYDNPVFAADKTPADFGWQTDGNNYKNWQVCEDGWPFYVSYTGSDSKRVWKEIIQDPDNFTVKLTAKIENLRAEIEVMGVKIELNCEHGNGNQIFDRESWSWFNAKDQLCEVTIARNGGGDLTIKLLGAGNDTPVTFTKTPVNPADKNVYIGVIDADGSAFFSDVRDEGISAQDPSDFGWDTDEVDGVKDYSGWTAADAATVTGDYDETTGNHRIWKSLLTASENYTVKLKYRAEEESSGYIKLQGQSIELDTRGGNGNQIYVKSAGTNNDWTTAAGCEATVYLTRKDSGDINVTIVGQGSVVPLTFTVPASEGVRNEVELGMYAGTATFAKITVTDPINEIEVPKSPAEFGWETDEIGGVKDFSGWAAEDAANISAEYNATTGEHRIWKNLLTNQNDFTAELDIITDNTSSAYVKVLGVTLELDSSGGDGNQSFVKLNGQNQDWVRGDNCEMHVKLERKDGGDLTITVSGKNGDTMDLTAKPTEENENLELGLYRGIASYKNITVTCEAVAPETYLVTFVDGLTGETIATDAVEEGNAATAPEAPAHEGYTFKGWDKDFSNVTADLTVTAQYEKNEEPPKPAEYTVTFVDGLTNETISTVKVEEGKAATAPEAPAHEGYTFKGWDKDFSNVTADLTVTAQYEKNEEPPKPAEYTVTFVDGLTNETISTVKVEEGKAATAPEAPAHEGYTFKGWDKDFSNVTTDLTVTALYEKNEEPPKPAEYTVTFIDGLTNETISTVKVEEGKAATAPEAPAHEGYTFKGWDKDFSNVTADLTVTAQYEKNEEPPKPAEYTVTFVDGLTNETISTVKVEEGKAATAPEAPAHEGYTFKGWDKDFSNVTADLTVTAQYEKNEEPPKPWVNPFKDVKESDWYYEGVKFAAQNELFNGTSPTTFEPDGDMTRAMLVTVLWRLDGKPAPKSMNSFKDVPGGQWYTEAVAWASENGVVDGVGNNLFEPDGNVTREQIAAIMYRYAGKKGYDTTKRADLSKYPDEGQVSSYAKEALSWANAEGLINGTNNGNGDVLDPKGSATRAQVATILMRYVENIVQK